MATNTYGGLTAEQRTFYELRMLPRAVPNFVHLSFGQTGVSDPTKLPEHKGDVIQWRRLSAFSAVTTPLTDGVTPDGQDISITSVTGTVSEYGSYVRFTQKLASMGIDRVMVEASDALGEQAGDSLDQLVRNTVVAGTTVQYSGTATSRATVAAADKLDAAEILEAVATLKVNNARPIFGNFFGAIIHPYSEYDMYQDSVIQNLLFYSKDRGESNPWTSGYIGDALGVRFYCSSNARVFQDAGASSTDVHASLFIGKSAFGIGGLAAYMPAVMKGMQQGNNTGQKVSPLKLIVHEFGSAGSADPLNQRASVAWYTTFTTARLVEAFMVRVEHAATIQT